MTRPLAKMAAFTLVELVTVVLLIGLIAAIGMPRMFQADIFRQRGYFDELLQAARYAQKLAVGTGCEVQLTINAASFALRQPANAGQCRSGTYTWSTVVALPGTAPPYTAPSNVTVTAGTGTVVFLPSGQATVGLTNPVTVNGTHSMQIYATTGYVERL